MSELLRDLYRLPIPCPSCLKSTEKSIAWLVENRVLACGYCGSLVDLTIEETRAFIEQADKLCRAIDGPTAKGG